MTDLTIVIPAYNEADTIIGTLEDCLNSLPNLTLEVLVVDDGSKDATAMLVRNSYDARVKLIQFEKNQGYGAALRAGFEKALGRAVAFMDADGQFDPTDLGKMVERTQTVQIVAGYRAKRQDPWLRKFYSWGYNKLVRAMLGTRVRDCDCALKVFRRDVLAMLLPQSTGFFVNAEMLTKARQHGYSIVEVPVSHRPRRGGESKVSVMEIPRTLIKLITFWWKQVVMAPEKINPPATVLATRVNIKTEAKSVFDNRGASTS